MCLMSFGIGAGLKEAAAADKERPHLTVPDNGTVRYMKIYKEEKVIGAKEWKLIRSSNRL